MLESLIKAGAFDFVGRERAELFACIDDALASSAAAHRDRASGQVSLFDEATHVTSSTKRRSINPWSEHEKLSYEKELLGFYVSGHPLDAYIDLFAAKAYQPIAALGELPDRAVCRIAGTITQLEKRFRRSDGKPYAIIFLEDLTGTIEVFLWDDIYSKVADLLAPGRVIAVQATIDTRDDRLRAVAQKVKVLTVAKTNGAPNGTETPINKMEGEPAILLRFSPEATSEELREVREIIASSPGPRPVQLLFDRANGDPLRLDAGAQFHVDLTRELEEKLSRWLISTKPERRTKE
jgi:DNA polymerase-3 subunit alpha